MIRVRRLVLAGFAAGAVFAQAERAPAQEEVEKPDGFPERPLTMIVPYGPGGGSDQLSRAMASAMEPLMGVGIQVVNKPGGGGLAAVPDFMAAPPDGYTVLESIDDIVTNHASNKLDLDPATDMVPICMAQVTFNQIYVRPDDERFSDWEGFVAYAEDHPGEVTLATLGSPASMERVNMRYLEEAAGIETNQIAFDKPAERYSALIGGHTDALFEQPGDVRNFLEAGQMKPILTLLKERPSAFSDTQSLADIGVDFDPLLRFRGFWTRPDVPEERRQYLEQVCERAWKSDSFQSFNEENYMHLIDSYRGSDAARQMVADSIDSYTTVYKEIGLIE